MMAPIIYSKQDRYDAVCAFNKIRDLIEDASKHNKDMKQARIMSVDEFGNYISLTD